MTPPKFLFAPDKEQMQLYIVHTEFPLSLIVVNQTIPAQLLVLRTELLEEDEDFEVLEPDEMQILTDMLHAAGDWYRTIVPDSLDKN